MVITTVVKVLCIPLHCFLQSRHAHTQTSPTGVSSLACDKRGVARRFYLSSYRVSTQPTRVGCEVWDHLSLKQTTSRKMVVNTTQNTRKKEYQRNRNTLSFDNVASFGIRKRKKENNSKDIKVLRIPSKRWTIPTKQLTQKHSWFRCQQQIGVLIKAMIADNKTEVFRCRRTHGLSWNSLLPIAQLISD